MTPRGRNSIAGRLLVAGGASVALFALVMVGILVSFAGRASDEAYDRLLLASAQSIADAIRVVDGEVAVDVPIAAFSMLSIGKEDRIHWRVTEEGRAHVTGYPDLMADFAFPDGRDVAFADGRHLGLPIRTAGMRRLISVGGEPRRVVVLVAETRDSRAALAAEIRTYALLPLAVVCLAAVVMIPLTVRSVMRPVDALGRSLERRDPGDYGPVGGADVPREVAPLVDALDHFVARLRDSLERNHAFLAEAAHQLRTPLASLGTMAELAAGEDDPAALRDQVARIRRNAVAAARITNQLLADAAVENRLRDGRRERVRLDRIAMEAVNDAVGFSGSADVRFTVEDGAEGVAVLADPVALREALRNLIENAGLHGASGEPVEVVLSRPEGEIATVSVDDRGPGIPDGEKQRLVRRFERGAAADRGGSGLGLSIADRVAAAHGGRLRLLDRAGGGLSAVLELPLRPGREEDAA